MNKPINKLKSSAVPMPMEHIDTDQIIPARFLKAVDKLGFGDNLFRDWRYDKNNHIITDFVLNNPIYNGEILLTGKNFGCGSSREHAAWAIKQYGFRVVISSGFADIFKSNALNNGVLVVEVTDEFLGYMFDIVQTDPNAQFEVSLDDQQISLPQQKAIFNFEIDSYKKECLLEGKDDLNYLLDLKATIMQFEQNQEIY